jgi:hypothetical protein
MIGRVLVCLCLVLAPTPPLPGGDDPGDRALLQSVDLAGASWSRNGEAPEDAPDAGGDPGLVHLPFDAQGVRWSCRFRTEQALTARLYLDWSPAQDGLLFELVIDGERLPPARDGWRPDARRLLVDLGSRWLGQGEHLLEFVARETPEDVGLLHLTALELREP